MPEIIVKLNEIYSVKQQTNLLLNLSKASEEKSVTESMDSIKRRESTDSTEGDEEEKRTLQEQLDASTSSGSSVVVRALTLDRIANLEFVLFFI